jgi:hypothetical protein
VDAPKIVITGTGRAGTTLLVQLLTELGMDTGLHDGKLTPYGHGVHAGLECRVDDPGSPGVVKDMTLGFRMRAVLESGTVTIGHVLLPRRRLDVATASRIRAARYGREIFRHGALTGTMRVRDQRKVLESMEREVISALDDFAIPWTVLEFPRFATDAAYTHAALTPIVPQATVADVEGALRRLVRPELIHEQPLSRSERWRTRAMTLWMAVVRNPIERLRTRIDPEGAQARFRASVAETLRREAEADRERAHHLSQLRGPRPSSHT